LEEITYLAIELLVHSSPKIKATFVSFFQRKLLVHFYFLHKFSRFDMFLVKIQIDLVENDADQIVLCCLHTYMGGKSQKISSLFVKLVPFFS